MGWLTGWAHRKNHYIGPASGAGQNYQKRIVVHFGVGVDSGEDVYLNEKCLADFGDIRFADHIGTILLDYWIEEKVDGDYSIFWVEISEDLSVYDRKIYIYYGKVGATSVANGDNTFIFFDDFEVDLSKWTTIGQLEGPYSDCAFQHKMVRTADDSIHVLSLSYPTGGANSYIKHSISRDSGVSWEVINVKTWTPIRIDFPAIAKDVSDNLYLVYGWMGVPADGKIYFKKATVNKSVPGAWTWAWGSEITVDGTITDGGAPDIIVDSNNYIHVAYIRQLANKCRWARSINGGTTWTIEEITFPVSSQGYMSISIDKDSLNNLYLGMGPMFIQTRKFYVEKIAYLGGTSWLQESPVEISSKESSFGQLNVLPDDRICVLYGFSGEQTVVFRKSTNPSSVSTWDAEILIADGTAGIDREAILAFDSASHLKVVYLSATWHNGLDLVVTESNDGGATWGAIVQVTDLATSKRAPASLRELVGGEMLLIYRDYVEWETKYGNLWFLTDVSSTPVLIYGSTPTFSADHAYSGAKSVKLLPGLLTTIQWMGGPTTNHAVHVHLYDQMSSLKEYTVFSFDAGEDEESFLGIINDIDHYEYMLDGVTYDSGIDRAIGWHEFQARMSPGLKEFLIDGNLMPVTGIKNYGAFIIIISVALSQVNNYWDAVFETKFVNPEPAHSTWGTEEEESGGGIATFMSEDVMKSIFHPKVLDDIVYLLSQSPLTIENILYTLSGSSHTPVLLAEDVMVVLTRIKILFAQDILHSLTGSLHVPVLSEDILVSLLKIRIREVAIEFGIPEPEIVKIIMTTQGKLLRRLTSKLYQKL